MINNLLNKCLECNEIIQGRSDKKFCSQYCKSAYHYKENLKKDKTRFQIVEKILKKNRQILKQYNKAGKATVVKEKLLNEGFNPKYFTNYWRTKNNNLYLFCYEYGFMEKIENGKSKYILVIWQEYME